MKSVECKTDHKADENTSSNMLVRFLKNIKGVTAIEFGILAPPFFFLVFAIIETSTYFFASLHLEAAVDNVTRKVRTGILNELTTKDEFKTALCGEIIVLLNCETILTNVSVAATFDDLTPSITDDEGELEENFDELGPRKIIQVTATYKWPIYTNYASPLKHSAGSFALIHVTGVTRSEPFELTQPGS